MKMWRRLTHSRMYLCITRGMLLRIAADVLLLNLGILLALVLRFVLLVAFEPLNPARTQQEIFWQYTIDYLNSWWVLTLTCLVVLAAMGCYTHSRFYCGRYKMLVIAQAISLAFAIFSCLSYYIDWASHLPRGALLLSWIISGGLLIGARLWSHAWRSVVRTELHSPSNPEQRKVRNVLVIGGAGYIGSALLPKLLERGYRVRLLDLLLYGTEAIEGVINHPRLEIMQADFRHVDKVVDAMHDMDAVIHLGAIVGDPACALNSELTMEVNLMATRMIAEVAKGYGISRFIFASTCSVYGASDEWLDEHSVLNPVSLYARSKIASEGVLLDMVDATFAPTILRFGTIYGLSGRTRFDLVINLLTAKAIMDGRITVMGGDQWRPFVHVDDAALAVFKTLEARLPLVRNQIFNVGSDEQNHTLGEVGELIQRLVPTAELLDLGQDGDRRNYRVNFKKIRTQLGFTPQWTVEQGVQQVIEAFGSGRVEDYQNAKYSNVKFLSEQGSEMPYRWYRWAEQRIQETPELAVH